MRRCVNKVKDSNGWYKHARGIDWAGFSYVGLNKFAFMLLSCLYYGVVIFARLRLQVKSAVWVLEELASLELRLSLCELRSFENGISRWIPQLLPHSQLDWTSVSPTAAVEDLYPRSAPAFSPYHYLFFMISSAISVGYAYTSHINTLGS